MDRSRGCEWPISLHAVANIAKSLFTGAAGSRGRGSGQQRLVIIFSDRYVNAVTQMIEVQALPDDPNQ